MNGIDIVLWVLAVAPVVLLIVLVASGRVRTVPAAAITLATACVIAVAAFGASGQGMVTALTKGLWTGVWIAAVIWAALLLSAVSRRMGMDDIGGTLSSVLPRQTENILIVAWIFPSFIQGVAGFGTPIAIAAPMLLSMGVRPVLAVALPVIGYHWSVGLGSVGSSFYMGALTAQLSEAETLQFAATVTILLGVNAIVAGLLVAVMFAGRQGLREGWRVIVVAGPAMAVVQALVARLEPGVGAIAGGAAGMVVIALMAAMSRRIRRPVTTRVDVQVTVPSIPDRGGGSSDALSEADGDRAARPRRNLAVVMLPYFALLVLALAVLVPPAVRQWVRGHLTWGPSFPAASTSKGFHVDAVDGFQPFSVLAHPGSFIVAATLLAILAWQIMGQWPRGALRELLPSWLTAARKASWSVLLFASVATVMADSGMVRTVAEGIAEATGRYYPALAGAIGALGSFTTGSTTNSNALFAGLQADVARLIDVAPGALVAAQTAGGNVGNAVAPVILLLGASAVGMRDELRPILRAVMLPAAVLLLTVMGLTYALVSL